MRSKSKVFTVLMSFLLSFCLAACGSVTTTITPDPIEVLEDEYITVNNVTVEVGDTADIVVNFFPSKSVDRVVFQVPTQYSQNILIKNGKVTGLKAGTVSTVTCKTENTEHSATFTVTVTGYVEDENGAVAKFNAIGGFEKMPALDNLSVADSGWTVGGTSTSSLCIYDEQYPDEGKVYEGSKALKLYDGEDEFNYSIAVKLEKLQYNNENFKNNGVYTFSWIMQGGQIGITASANSEFSEIAVKGAWTRYYLLYQMDENKTEEDVDFALEFVGSSVTTAQGVEVPWGYVDDIKIEYGNTVPNTDEQDYINYVVDGSFENQVSDEALSAPWTVTGSYDPASLLAVGNAGNASSGTMYAGYWDNAATDDFYIEQTITGIPANMYSLKVMILNGDTVTPTNAYLYIKDYGGTERKQTIATTGFNAGYKEYKIPELEITTGTATIGVRINVGANTSSKKYWINIDDFALYQEGEWSGYDLIGLTNELTENESGFEGASVTDCGWTEDDGTATAAVDATDVKSGSNALKVTGTADQTYTLTKTLQNLDAGEYILSIYAKGVNAELKLTANSATENYTIAAESKYNQYTLVFNVAADGAAEIALELTFIDGADIYLDEVFIANINLVLEVDDIELYQSKTHTIVTKFFPSAKAEKVSYSGYDSAIITINAAGRITAVSAGETTVTVTSVSGAITTFKVTVLSNVLTAFTTDNLTTYITGTVRLGSLVFKPVPSVATIGTISFDIKSGDSVSLLEGTVTGVKKGITTITATESTLGLTCDFTITVQDSEEILEDFTSKNTMKKGSLESLGWSVENNLELSDGSSKAPAIAKEGLTLWLAPSITITGTFAIQNDIVGIAAGSYKIAYSVTGNVGVSLVVKEGDSELTVTDGVFEKTAAESSALSIKFVIDYTGTASECWGYLTDIKISKVLTGLSGYEKFNYENDFSSTTSVSALESLGWKMDAGNTVSDINMTNLSNANKNNAVFKMTYTLSDVEAGSYAFSMDVKGGRYTLVVEINGSKVAEYLTDTTWKADWDSVSTIGDEFTTDGTDIEIAFTLTYLACTGDGPYGTISNLAINPAS